MANTLDPKRSWHLMMVTVMLFFWASIRPIVFDQVPEDFLIVLAFLWATGIGILLGWYYPNKDLFFSMCLPIGQEAEFAGLYVYCTQILAWVPPLIFTLMVEAEISRTYGVVAASGFFLIGAGILSFAATWPEILEECRPGPESSRSSRRSSFFFTREIAIPVARHSRLSLLLGLPLAEDPSRLYIIPGVVEDVSESQGSTGGTGKETTKPAK